MTDDTVEPGMPGIRPPGPSPGDAARGNLGETEAGGPRGDSSRGQQPPLREVECRAERVVAGSVCVGRCGQCTVWTMVLLFPG
ncbi:MAG: hypothetical protein ACRDSM_03835 [Pseudonocardiaceae bacterium]